MTAKARRRRARKVAPGGAQRHPGFVIDLWERTPAGVRGVLAPFQGADPTEYDTPGWHARLRR